MQFHYFKPYSEINGEMLSLRYQETVTLESNWTFLARITLWNSILGTVFYFYRVFKNICRSKWPRGLRRSSATPRLLGLWVLIPPGVWKSVSCECCVLSGRDLCDGLITRPEESYRLWCVVGCELETSRMRRPWPIGGFRGKRIKIKNIWASYFYWTVRHFNSWRIKTNLMTLAIFIHFLCAQHVSDINISIIRSLRLFCWITTLVVLFLFRCVLGFRCGWVLQAEVCYTDTTPTQPHRNSNEHRTKNNTTNVVIQQNSRKLLMMDILMSETCWAHKKWNKVASDIKLVFYFRLAKYCICTKY